MILKTKTEYTIRTLILLAVSKKPIGENEISNQLHISLPQVEEIMEMLKSHSLVCQENGQGGYCLTKKPTDISVWETIMEFEGITLTDNGKTVQTDNSNPEVCRLHENVLEIVDHALSGLTLESLVNQQQ